MGIATDDLLLATVQAKIADLIHRDLGEEYNDEILAVQTASSRGGLVSAIINDLGMDLKFVDHVLTEAEMEWLRS